MRVLTRADVESVLTIDETIAAVEEGFRQLALGTVQMPQRAATPIPPHNGLHLSMPAYVGGDPGTLTIKIVTVYPDNPAKHDLPMIQGMLLLYAAATGELLVAEGGWRQTSTPGSSTVLSGPSASVSFSGSLMQSMRPFSELSMFSSP